MGDEGSKKQESVIIEKEEDKKKKAMPIWKKIVLGVVIFFAGVIGLAVFATRGAQSAGDEFIAKLQSGDCSGIYSQSTDGFKEQGTIEKWNEFCEGISPVLQGTPEQKGVSVQSNSGEDQVSQVKYLIAGTDGVNYGVALDMVNKDGGWQIHGFDSDALEEGELEE